VAKLADVQPLRRAAQGVVDALGTAMTTEVHDPWTQAAAQTALEGSDDAVLAFLSSDLATARENDDRSSVIGIAAVSTNLEHKLAAETASVGTAAQVRDFLTLGAYPGQEHDDRVHLMQIMTAGGPGVQDAANTAMGGTHADVRAFLTKGQYIAREHDNRVLITQAIATGGPEVQAAAQAAMAGPTSGLEPFLQTGLPLARQRDAFTAAHVATINSYLSTIDGNASLAREYAAQAARSYATARGAADEAAGYANQAQASAAQAADWATKAANSAAQAKVSADQAAAHAKQARTAAAAAQESARSAGISANAAAGYAQQAKQYATDAKTASDQAQSSAIAAGKSRDEAFAAAREAAQLIMAKQQADTAEGKMQHETAVVDDTGRVTYVRAIPRPDTKYENVRDTLATCVLSDPHAVTSNGYPVALPKSKAWHTNTAGDSVCTITVTVKVTGTLDYFLSTCPEPNLSIAACTGKYSVWDTLLLRSEPISSQYDTTIDITELDYRTKYSPQAAAGRVVVDAVTGDFVKCWNNPGLNGPCGWAASNFIPYGTLGKAAKGIVAFRFALETGVELEQAKLALQATLNGYSDAVISKLIATADAIKAFRNTLKDGVGTDAALAALRADRNVDRALVRQLEIEVELAQDARATCSANSFPASTEVLLADGSRRPISTIRSGDRVLTTDPVVGGLHPQTVTTTFVHDTQRLVDIGLVGGGNLATTAGHRIYTEDRGWTVASALQPGDRLRTADGLSQTVSSLQVRTVLAPQTVYDLTVDGTHTFYVRTVGGEAQDLLVHNCLNIVADEGIAQAHTIDSHVKPNPVQAQAKAEAERSGRATIWNDQDTAVGAVTRAFQEWLQDPQNQVTLAKWKQKQGQQAGAGIGFVSTRDLLPIRWQLRDEGSLGKVYTKGNPADGSVSTPTGNTVVIQLRYVAKKSADGPHADNFVVYTSYPE
ncbi:polymorphic toxin-type HINT domain-containing protein, partial [Kitasatospora sp. NPDC047058]|uniref:polymorphic toxin-type HINT domain-containing protein n=1 Tax=Kitasatospora sp. NPDC047058 TaxID=3155620 RepID=UPI0033E50E83